MTIVLNRIAWCVSILMGYIITFLLGMMMDALDHGGFDDGAIFAWVISIGFFGLIFKSLFLSKKLIITALETDGGAKIVEQVSSVKKAFHKAKEEVGKKFNAFGEEVDEMKESEEIASVIGSEEEEKIVDEEDESTYANSASVATSAKGAASVDKEEKIPEKPKEPGFIKKFFAENALAKIGGILLFLAVLFLLQLVYTVIGPIGKLMIGFAVGFIVFGIGVFVEMRGYSKEARILMGTSILINYLVILSGRYLIGEELFTDKTILNDGVTFFLLIINTIFAVITSIAFRSHALLFFSFVVAFLNPFLISGAVTLTFFTMLSYGVLVSIGAIVLSYFYKEKYRSYAINLMHIAFLGGNTIILFTPFETTTEWLVKLACMATLSLASIILAYKDDFTEHISGYFFGLYLFFIALIGYGSYALGDLFLGGEVMVGYLIFMALTALSGVVVISVASITSIFYIILAPIFILLGLALADIMILESMSYIIIGVTVFYFAVFMKLFSQINQIMKYIFFAVMGLFALLFSLKTGDIIGISAEVAAMASIQVYAIILTVFLFLGFAYYFAGKKHMEYLYSVGTIFSILILLPLIDRVGQYKMISIVSIGLLVLANLVIPFINKKLLFGKIQNLILGLLAGVIFAVGEMFYFWYGEADQSTMTIGLGILLLAIVYTFIGFLMHQVLHYHRERQVFDEGVSAPNNDLVYALLGIAVSLFSLSVAYIFSKHSEVISAIWLFESSLLYYMYKRTRDIKVFSFAFVVMVIGLIKLGSLVDLVAVREFTVLIPLLIIFGSFVASLKFLEFEKRDIRYVHDIGHVIGVGLILLILSNIIPDHRLGLLVFGFAIFAFLLSLVYSRIYAGKVKYLYLVFLFWLFIYQISSLESFFRRADYMDTPFMKAFQYLSTLVFAFSFLVFNYLQRVFDDIKESETLSRATTIIFTLYLFVISSQYIFFLFNENVFTLTIYWGLISFICLSTGIQNDIVKLRTIGLYILSLTTAKILLHDIWSGLDDAIIRVIALMVVGGVMITISLLYSKKYGGDLKGEFSLDNFK